MLKQAVMDIGPAGWPTLEEFDDDNVAWAAAVADVVHAAVQPDAECVHMYNMAAVRGEHLVRLEASFKNGARQNHWVQVSWEDDSQGRVPHVCAVQSLVRLQHPSNPQATVLRVAGLRVYKPQPLEGGMMVAKGAAIDKDLYPVALDGVDCKLVCACSPTAYKHGTMFFMPFFNISKSY